MILFFYCLYEKARKLYSYQSGSSYCVLDELNTAYVSNHSHSHSHLSHIFTVYHSLQFSLDMPPESTTTPSLILLHVQPPDPTSKNI